MAPGNGAAAMSPGHLFMRSPLFGFGRSAPLVKYGFIDGAVFRRNTFPVKRGSD